LIYGERYSIRQYRRERSRTIAFYYDRVKRAVLEAAPEIGHGLFAAGTAGGRGAETDEYDF
jgi:hypothetical protein